MSTFDDLLQEARDAGVDPDWLERFEKASAGSPLRQEKKQLETQLQEITSQAQRYRTAALGSQFQQLGIKVKPDALNIPTDLDPLDNEAVQTWAVGMGLADPPPPPVPTEDQQGHQALVDASAGATGTPRHDARASALEAQTEEEFWARARAGGFVRQ